MSWIQKLYETYEQCISLANTNESSALTPPYHVMQQAHIEITIDGSGNFRRASVIEKEGTTIPATEKSATARTSAVVPHPLCDHIKYCAGDYLDEGEKENKYFEAYLKQLESWHHLHPKATAILQYVKKKTLLKDLIKEGVVPVSGDQVIRKLEPKQDKPPLFKQLTQDSTTKEYKPQNALIRWRVEVTNDLAPEVWKDKTLQNAWLTFCNANEASKAADLCMVTGRDTALADKHPNKIRNGKDGAKLISNKKEADSDFIYLGRFTAVTQAAGVGIEVSQKAHSALRWLIDRQGFSNGDQVIVAWSVAGKDIPDPFKNSADIFELDNEQTAATSAYQGDSGQSFALRLNNFIRGYRARLGSTDDVVVMALDSATPGRMAITYYRELTGSEFLDRLESWHASSAWPQNYSKELKFIGAPAPKDIAEAAFGRRLDEKLRKATVERLLPCIIDGQPIPRDLVESAVRRVTNRPGLEKWEWEKFLGIACALFRAHHKERSYQMTLETSRTSRDYLYGRLLAVAEDIEGRALYLAGEKRDTNAAKLMQRFADHPLSTWRTLELSLSPYKTRLRAKRPQFLRERESLLDEIISMMGNDFTNDTRLSGEFLLGYHCQRQVLRPPAKTENPEESNETNEGE